MMQKFNHIKLYQLVIVYVALIGVYVVVPHSVRAARQGLSTIALVMLGLIFVKSVLFLRQS